MFIFSGGSACVWPQCDKMYRLHSYYPTFSPGNSKQGVIPLMMGRWPTTSENVPANNSWVSDWETGTNTRIEESKKRNKENIGYQRVLVYYAPRRHRGSTYSVQRRHRGVPRLVTCHLWIFHHHCVSGCRGVLQSPAAMVKRKYVLTLF